MKLKHVFFSSLLLSTAFVACTNEDIENLQTEAKGTLALGEGYTINVSKGADSRAAFNGNTFSPYWEEGDKIGAAWFHEVTDLDPNDNSLVAYDGCGEISDPRQFRSNHPFELIKGEGTGRGEFESVTNAFAGAYVFYYPYDKNISMTDGSLKVTSVSQTQTMDCTPGKEWDAVNANMFAYGVAGLVPGGPTADEFVLNQVPVLYRLRFSFTDKIFLNLTKGMSIEKIIVEAKKKEGNDYKTVLVTTGTIVPPTASISYTDYNNGTLPAAKYEPGTNVDHLSINVENSDNSNYQITALETPTEKEFIFSALPFEKEADVVTFKIVTSNGYVFAKTVDSAAGLALINGTKEDPGAAYEGGQVVAHVALDTQILDDVAYTAEQFMEKWNAAQKSKKDVTIYYGENLVLNEDLVFDNVDENVVVTVKAHCDHHVLTANSLNVVDGNVVFADPLVVEGNAVSSAEANLTAVNLSANNVTANGYANLTIASAELLTVAASGDVTLSEISGKVGVKNIVVNKAGRILGLLTVEKMSINNMTNNGHVYVKADVTAEGTVVNNSNFELESDFTNKGTFNQYGDIITKEGKFVNASTTNGAVLNIYVSNAENDFDAIVNNAAESGKKAGTININTSNAGSTNDGEYVAFGVGSENKGIINILKGLLGTQSTSVTLQKAASGVINVSKDAKLFPHSNTIVGGRVVMLDLDSYINKQVTNKYVYFPVNGSTEWSTVPSAQTGTEKAGVCNLIVNGTINVTSTNESVLKHHNLYLENATVVVAEEFEMGTNSTIHVTGTSTIKGNVNTGMVEFGLHGTNTIEKDATLNLNRINLINNTGAELISFGSIKATDSKYNVNSASENQTLVVNTGESLL